MVTLHLASVSVGSGKMMATLLAKRGRWYYDWEGVVKSGRRTAYKLLILKLLIMTIMSDGEAVEKRRRSDGNTTSK